MTAEASARRGRREPNRLHRRTQRLEHLLTCVLGLLSVAAAAVAVAAGDAAYATVADRARAESAVRAESTAVLLADSVPITRGSGAKARMTPVRWTDRHGVERTAGARVTGLRHAGDEVPVWTSDDGRVVPPPTTLADASTAGVLAGLLAVAAGGVAVLLAGRGFYAWTGRRFRRAWEQEWERVGPQWTGTPSG